MRKQERVNVGFKNISAERLILLIKLAIYIVALLILFILIWGAAGGGLSIFYSHGGWSVLYRVLAGISAGVPILIFLVSILDSDSTIVDLVDDIARALAPSKMVRVVEWYSFEFEDFVGPQIIGLRFDSERLLENISTTELTDYSYIVLPAAKALEGVLKKIIVTLGLIDEERFVVNPNVSINHYFNPLEKQNIFQYLKDQKR
jgi:hypothetical protein